jgi:hypothetical protein
MPGDWPGDEPTVQQQVEAGRDVFAAGASQVNIILYAGGQKRPESAWRAWGNVPARNVGFTGRESLIAALRATLASHDRAVVQALSGMDGVGKTQLATEYAHRYAAEYEVVWWIAAEEPALIGDQFAALGAALGCIQPGSNTFAARDLLLPEQAAATRTYTEGVLSASHPGETTDPATWPAWARLMPHLLAANLAASTSPGLRQLACDARAYLVFRGHACAAYDFTAQLHRQWGHVLGDHDPSTLSIGDSLARALGSCNGTRKPGTWTRPY